MKKTIRHFGVESVTYEFDKFDVQRALIAYAKIARYKDGRKDSFDWREDENGELTMTITLRYEIEKDSES